MTITREQLVQVVRAARRERCPCGRAIKAAGLCAGHYGRKQHGLPVWDTPLRLATYDGIRCSDCGKRRPVARGRCKTCYNIWYYRR